MFKFAAAAVIAALPAGARRAAVSPALPGAQKCGIGEFECTGAAYSAGGYVSFANEHTVEELDVAGWWHVVVTAGGGAFAEYQYCTKDPEESVRENITASTKLICVAGERTDMVDPSVRVTWFYKDCDTFTKVVQTGPAEATADGSQTLAEVAQITCQRKSSAAPSERRQPAPPAPFVIQPRQLQAATGCAAGEYTCTGDMYTKPTSGSTKLGKFVAADSKVMAFSPLADNFYGFDFDETAGLNETRFCTSTMEGGSANVFGEASGMYCVTTSRNGQQNPTIFSRLQNKGCTQRFAEVVTLAPADATQGGARSDPAIAFVTCTRNAAPQEEEAVLSRVLKAEPVASQTCEPGEFVCDSFSYAEAGETKTSVDETIMAKEQQGWWQIKTLKAGAADQDMYCTRSAETADRDSLTVGGHLRCVASTDRSVFVEVSMLDCNNYETVTLAGAGAGADAFIGRSSCRRKGESA